MRQKISRPPVSAEDLTRSLCISGHRPQYLPRGEELEALLRALEYRIRQAVDNGFTIFYDGLADGIDYYAICILKKIREEGHDLKIIGVEPCGDYERYFRDHHPIERLHFMYDTADRIERSSDLPCSKKLFIARNHYMLDRCSAAIVVSKNERSGSGSTLHAAQKAGLAYCYLHALAGCKAPYPAPEDWPTELFAF